MKKTIAVVCAMKSEAQPLIDKLPDLKREDCKQYEIYSGNINGNSLLICISGVGMVNMASLVTYVAAKYSPDIFFNYGIIGGYGNVQKGSLVVVEDCININSTVFDAAPKGSGISLSRARLVTFSESLDEFPVVYKSDEQLVRAALSVEGKNVICGRLGSGDIWNKEYDKIMLFHSKYGVCGEDMEGYAMYQVANIFGIPALSLKGVSNNEILGQAYDYSVMETLNEFAFDVLNAL